MSVRRANDNDKLLNSISETQKTILSKLETVEKRLNVLRSRPSVSPIPRPPQKSAGRYPNIASFLRKEIDKRNKQVEERNKSRSVYEKFDLYVQFHTDDEDTAINTHLKDTVGDIMTTCFPEGWETMPWSHLKKNHKKEILKAVELARNSEDMAVVSQCMSQWAIKSLMEQKLHSVQKVNEPRQKKRKTRESENVDSRRRKSAINRSERGTSEPPVPLQSANRNQLNVSDNHVSESVQEHQVVTFVDIMPQAFSADATVSAPIVRSTGAQNVRIEQNGNVEQDYRERRERLENSRHHFPVNNYSVEMGNAPELEKAPKLNLLSGTCRNSGVIKRRLDSQNKNAENLCERNGSHILHMNSVSDEAITLSNRVLSVANNHHHGEASGFRKTNVAHRQDLTSNLPSDGQIRLKDICQPRMRVIPGEIPGTQLPYSQRSPRTEKNSLQFLVQTERTNFAEKTERFKEPAFATSQFEGRQSHENMTKTIEKSTIDEQRP
ncbi:hypothetical protein FGB62_92g13 [Gracilaria domingensis]|nr:hypothetical protein FGB62_92g13 [Gracilaria domingensis]